MTAAEFKQWRKGLNLTQKAAAAELDLSVPTVQLYEQGYRKDTGRPVVIPVKVVLACDALSHRIARQARGDRLETHMITKDMQTRVNEFLADRGIKLDLAPVLMFDQAQFEGFAEDIDMWLHENALEGGYAKLVVPDAKAKGSAVVALHFFRPNDAVAFAVRWGGATRR